MLKRNDGRETKGQRYKCNKGDKGKERWKDREKERQDKIERHKDIECLSVRICDRLHGVALP